MADLACRTVAGADLVGVTLMENGKPTTAVFTDPTARVVDGAQYETGAGPCLDAYRHGRVFRVDSTTEDMRWRHSSQTAAAHWIMSTLSLPLAVRSHPIGALNLYSKSRGAFTEDEEETGRLFAEQASVALANRQLYETPRGSRAGCRRL
ncbi:MAG: GAF domain-containing protein [Actinomycetota bacterium]|nr:GAF domain-containing protein [Actinomycetota bacterium]